MAKLKIYDNNDTTQQIPNKDGYRNVARNLLLVDPVLGTQVNLSAFQAASERDRSNLLQTYASGHTIFQLTRAPEQNQGIDNSNCKIKIKSDERGTGGNYGKHNLVLPEILTGDPPLNVGYLGEYVKAISELYGKGTNPEVTSACEFLFGIMLLTRCR